jgi:hypothetical protein
VQSIKPQPYKEDADHVAGRLHRGDAAGDERRLHLAHRIVDRDAVAFVEDLHRIDLGGGSGAVLVGEGQGDVEGQDLIGVPGEGQFLKAEMEVSGMLSS